MYPDSSPSEKIDYWYIALHYHSFEEIVLIQVEYDLANSSEDDLQLLSSERVEQSAIPTAMAWYPPLTTESFIMLINNQVLHESSAACNSHLYCT